jgi:methyltransferase (TIGR00027 family)
MRAHQPSQTAAWVAGARTLGQLLPVAERLAHDPYGIAFMRGPVATLAQLLLTYPGLCHRIARATSLQAFLWWMQLRTRAFDDVLQAFLASGGRQVVLLGAGYDCRALRFAAQLDEVCIIEVDHPSTQAEKRRVMREAQLASPARHVAWNFESQPLPALAQRLSQEGLVPDERVLTLWEGVTMYLSERAIVDTLALVRGYGAPGSWLAFNYVDARVLRRAEGDQRITQRLASLVGEPFRYGFDPGALPAWLARHGYVCRSDETDLSLSRKLLPAEAASAFASANRHIALAETLGPSATSR